MTRKVDTLWRDSRLPLVHGALGFPMPLPGMTFVTVEYDDGEAIGLVNYTSVDQPLPKGGGAACSFTALASLRRPDGTALPFLTAQYDSRNWSFRLFPHNEAARDLLGTDGWLVGTEQHFVRLLYRLRGRTAPDLSAYGVTLSETTWTDAAVQPVPEDWPGQQMSVRRRNYEPEGPWLPRILRIPCADIDLAVVGRTGLNLLVDFKLDGAYVDPEHPTHRAMSGILSADHLPVPSVIVKYDPSGDRWKYHVWCLNEPAEYLLRNVMRSSNAVTSAWRPDGWTYLDESRWESLLIQAQSW